MTGEQTVSLLLHLLSGEHSGGMSLGPGQEGESEGSIDRAKPQGLAWEVPSSEEGAKWEYVGAVCSRS